MRSAENKKQKKTPRLSDEEVVRVIREYRDASEKAREPRQEINNFNWDVYNLKQDWSHKVKGQSTEFIPKLSNAVEHFCSLLQTGITSNSDDWFTTKQGYNTDEIFDPDTVWNIMSYYLDQIKPSVLVSNMAKSEGLDSRLCVKVHGEVVEIERFVEKEEDEEPKEELQFGDQQQPEAPPKIQDVLGDKKKKLDPKNKKKVQKWKPKCSIVDYRNHYPDPFPNGENKLYDIEEYVMDLHILKKLAKKHPDKYNAKAVADVKKHFIRSEVEKDQDAKENRETITKKYFHRKKITVTEFWGTILDDDGEAHEDLTNVLCLVVNDEHLVRGPEKNYRFDGKAPYTDESLIEIPNSKEGKGFFDAGASLSTTFNESYNLFLDGMFDEIKGIKQVRAGLLEKPEQIADGFRAGMTLFISDETPMGVNVVEKCKTGQVPADAMQFYNNTEQLVNEAMFMNDIKLGNMPPASTKATVANLADQSITGVFTSIIKQFEDKCITPMLNMLWNEILQNMDDDTIAHEEFVALVGEQKAISILKLSSEERFLRGSNSAQFEVRGISAYAQKMRDNQKLLNLLQILGQSPILMQQFMQKYSVPKYIQQIITTTGLREEQIRLTDQEAREEKINQAAGKALAASKEGGNGQQPGGMPPQTGEVEQTSQGPQGPMEGNIDVPQ